MMMVAQWQGEEREGGAKRVFYSYVRFFGKTSQREVRKRVFSPLSPGLSYSEHTRSNFWNMSGIPSFLLFFV